MDTATGSTSSDDAVPGCRTGSVVDSDEQLAALRVLAENCARDVTGQGYDGMPVTTSASITAAVRRLEGARIALESIETGHLPMSQHEATLFAEAIDWNRTYVYGGIVDDRTALLLDDFERADDKLVFEARLADDEALLRALDTLLVEVMADQARSARTSAA